MTEYERFMQERTYEDYNRLFLMVSRLNEKVRGELEDWEPLTVQFIAQDKISGPRNEQPARANLPPSMRDRWIPLAKLCDHERPVHLTLIVDSDSRGPATPVYLYDGSAAPVSDSIAAFTALLQSRFDAEHEALMTAISAGDLAHVTEILEHEDRGFFINRPDSNGLCPLHVAVAGGSLDIVDRLTRSMFLWGEVLTPQGQSALDLAIANGDKAIAANLLSSCANFFDAAPEQVQRWRQAAGLPEPKPTAPTPPDPEGFDIERMVAAIAEALADLTLTGSVEALTVDAGIVRLDLAGSTGSVFVIELEQEHGFDHDAYQAYEDDEDSDYERAMSEVFEALAVHSALAKLHANPSALPMRIVPHTY